MHGAITIVKRPHTWLSLLWTLVFLQAVTAQKENITLEEVYRLSRQNYPAIHQKDLISQTSRLTIQNLNSSFLPQVNINIQASYQSEVTKVDIPLPGIKVPSQSRDQYKAIADVSQLIFDGGLSREQKNIQLLSSSAEESSVEIELYAVRNRINQLYFNILYQDELLKQTDLLLKDVQFGINKVKAQVENGTTLRSNQQVLEAQYLQVGQKTIEIKNTRKGLIDALSLLTGRPLSEMTVLQVPAPRRALDTSLNRPEIRFYEEQAKVTTAQQKLLGARNLPKTSAFLQAGYGKPGLNLLSDQFDAFYIAGLRFNWSLGNLYNAKRDKQLLTVSRERIDLQKETFRLNTRAALKQQEAEISRYNELLSSDLDIIALREKISAAAKAQLENAIINANDYLREINAADEARQSMTTHSLQLLQAQVNYQIISGNF